MVTRYLFYISQNYAYAILRPLQGAIWARGDHVAWFLEGREVDGQYLLKNEQQLQNISAVQDFKPDVVFVPGNTVPNFITGLKVAVFHGFNSGKLNRRGFEDHFNIRGCFDLYCTQGPNTTDPFIKLAKKHQHFLVKETGWPALDPLFLPSASLRPRATDTKSNKKPCILMCSTFSRALSGAPHLFETIKALSVTGRWQWLIQFHPKMPRDIVEKYKGIEGDFLQFIETDDVLPLLQQADVMLCDTSSVLMMFMMQHKPVVTFNNISPKGYMLNITDTRDLEESLSYALQRPAELMGKINDFVSATHPYQDGLSSQRVLTAVDEMLSVGAQNKSQLTYIIKRKPLNLLRKFKIRKKLRYWKL